MLLTLIVLLLLWFFIGLCVAACFIYSGFAYSPEEMIPIVIAWPLLLIVGIAELIIMGPVKIAWKIGNYFHKRKHDL